MNKLKTILIALLMACAPAFSEGTPQRRIQLHGVYSAEQGGHWQSGNILTEGARYSISNNSGNTLTVMILGGSRDQHITVMQGQRIEFIATGTRLDLFTGQVGGPVKGIELRQVSGETETN